MYPDVEEVVETAWETQIEGSRGYRVSRKIKSCQIALSSWSKGNAEDSNKEVRRLKAEIEEVGKTTGRGTRIR